MYLDFIKTPFNNNPSMQKYSGSLISETPRSSYLEQKINQVDLHGSDLYGETELFQRSMVILDLKTMKGFAYLLLTGIEIKLIDV